MKPIEFSIIIPVYKSTTSLEILAQELKLLFTGLKRTYEVLFINDSPFNFPTCSTLEKIEKQFAPHVKEIRLRKNYGQQMALLVGFSRALGNYIITMDDDLQHPVSEIPKLIDTIEKNTNIDAVFAIPPYIRKKHSLWRNLGSWLLAKLEELFIDKPKGLVKSSFRIIKKDIINFIVKNYSASPASSTLVIMATDNIVNITINHEPRKYDRSHYSFSKLLTLTLNNIVQYTSLPLALLGIMGTLVFIFSMLFIIWILIRKLFLSISFPGYTSTVILISFFGGLNLFGIGIIGEYLLRIIKEQRKPKLDDLYVKK